MRGFIYPDNIYSRLRFLYVEI